MTGVLSTTDLNDASLVAKAKQSPEIVGLDLVKEVIPPRAFQWSESLSDYSKTPQTLSDATALAGDRPLHVVAVDYGMKWNILRHLSDMGCRVSVVPGTASADDILAMEPDGVFLSNGPGDPRPLDYAIGTIRDLIGQKPVFGICLGQQLLGLAMGGEIYKLKFGHRGANQPVLNTATNHVEITTQNHGFAVAADSLPDDAEVTHINLNDRTVEGIRHRTHPVFGVQYHPEASAGPHDSQYLFGQFGAMMLDNVHA
jgi:carbamoyl-phosphate synthase small subunit